MLAISFEVEGRVLGLQVQDEAPQGWRQPLAARGPGAEEALHALRVEALRPPLEGPPGGRAGFPGSPVRRSAEQHQGPDQLVVPLLGPAAQELDLLPLVGRPDAPPAPAPAHLRFPPRYAAPRRSPAKPAPRERKHATSGALPPGRLGDGFGPATGRALRGRVCSGPPPAFSPHTASPRSRGPSRWGAGRR